MGRKERYTVNLSTATAAALTDYKARRRSRFTSVSEAADHLLQRALIGEVDEGLEGLLVPLLERRVEEAAARAVEERVAPLLKAQTDRLAGLLVKSGKDALSSVGVGVAILERLTGDRATAQRVAAEARLQAGPAYTAPALRGREQGEG